MSGDTSFDYEPTDISSRLVTWIAAGLAVFVVAVPVLTPLAFPDSMRHLTPSAPPALSSDAPVLEIAPRAELKLERRGDDRFSETYGWTDRDHGIVRIPVSRAIDLLAQRGLSGWRAR
jgi:hypothetical protein